MTTPYDKQLSPTMGCQVNRENPRAVLGDVAVKEHRNEKIRTVWWMTSDKAMPSGCRWHPLGYAETEELGRFIVHAGWFTAYVMAQQNPSTYCYGMQYIWAPERNPSSLGKVDHLWVECNMRAHSHEFNAEEVFCLGTVIEPRGVIPKRAFDWIEMGQLIPDYKPTYDYYPIGSPERVALMGMTFTRPNEQLSEKVYSVHSLTDVATVPENIVRHYADAVAQGVVVTPFFTDVAYIPDYTDVARRHIAMNMREVEIHGKRRGKA